MAKKKTNTLNPKNELIRELVDSDFIKNPLVFSQLSGDFTAMQTNILIELVSSLQTRINDYLVKLHREAEGPQTMLFTPEEMMSGVLNFQIPMRDLGVNPKSYDELEEACHKLLKLDISYRTKDKETGEERYVMQNIFSKISFPTSEINRDGIRYNYAKGNRRTGQIEISMLAENVQQVFDMRRGYVEHIKRIVDMCKKKQSPRVYIYLSSYKHVGHKLVNYLEFKEFLGLLRYNAKRTEIIENKYGKFSQFCSNVLDPIRDELNELAEANSIEFSFDYIPVYTRGQQKGDPDKLKFVIKLSDMGRNRRYRSLGNQQRNDLEEVLRTEYGLNDSDLMSLRDMITDDVMLMPLTKEIEKMAERVEHYKPRSVRAYVVQSLRNFLRQLALKIDAEQLAAHDEPEQKVAEEAEVYVPRLTEEDLQCWNMFLEMVQDTIGKKEFDTWFSAVNIYEFKDNTVTISVPELFVSQHIEENLLHEVRDALYAAFGDGVRLLYVKGS